MQMINKRDEIDPDRRHFFGLAAAELAMCRSAAADTLPAASRAADHSSFGPLKQVSAGDLNVGYAEEGPANGPVVILLHGWPWISLSKFLV